MNVNSSNLKMTMRNRLGKLPAIRGAALFLICSAPALAEPPPVILDTGWVLMTGDDPGWADPSLDDAKWHPTRVGVPWEEAGFEGYDGFAWYRTRCVIPDIWRDHPSERGLDEGLMLLLGPIDDVDVTYFNGVEVGRTGRMPPDYATAYAQDRMYRIPPDAIRWGQTNVVAVRVYDGEAPGGIYRGPVVVRPPALVDFLELSLQPGVSNGVYDASNPMVLSCSISNQLSEPVGVVLEATLQTDRVGEPRILERIQAEVELEGQAEVATSLEFHPTGPGFYQVTCTLGDGDSPWKSTSMIVGYSPEDITTALTREADFDSFWLERKQDLAAVEPEFQVTPSDLSSETLAVYLVEMRSYGNVQIRGWYSVPRSPGPHPGILHVPGYTGTMDPVLDRTEVAHLALNPRGHGNSKDDLDPGDREYMFLGFDPDHPENYVYVGAYLDCIRAVDFLASRPEIDASRIGVEGGSQGGGLSFATAALDPRIAYCAPDIPWLGDWIGYLNCAPAADEDYSKLRETIPGLSQTTIHRVMSYVDTMNLADRIRCPVLMSVGLQDGVCPPRTAFGTYNHLQSKKTYRVYPFSGHQVPAKHDVLKRLWVNELLGVRLETVSDPVAR